MPDSDDKKKQQLEEAAKRAHRDVHTEAEVEGAGHAEYEAQRKEDAITQAQMRRAAEAKAAADKAATPAAEENRATWQALEQQNVTNPEDDPARQRRDSLQRNRWQEKRAEHNPPPDDDREIENVYDRMSVTEHRMDEMASEAVPDSPEALENEAGPVDNISNTGASGTPEEIDQISGPPLPSGDKALKDKKDNQP